MAIIVILQMTTASTTRTNPTDVRAFSLEGLIYVLLSIAIISQALDNYRQLTAFYWLSIGAGVIGAASLITGFRWISGKTMLAIYMALHCVLIFASLPDLTNHEVYLILIYGLGLWGYFKNRRNPLLILRQFLPLLLSWMYLWAAFHKINSDFLFSPGSCAASMSFRIFNWLPTGPMVTTVAVLVIAVELILGISVLIPRLRGLFILLAFLFHSLLLLSDVAPFTAVLYPLLVILLPTAVLQKWLKSSAKRDLFIYTTFTMISLLLFEILLGHFSFGQIALLRQVPFFFGALPAAWSIFVLLRENKWTAAPEDCGISKNTIYAMSILLSIFLFFWGGQTYIGLRSNGVFDMYSNVATASGRQNHLIAPHFLSDLFPYQDDLVRAQFITPPKHWKLRRLQNAWVPRVTLMNLTERYYSFEGPISARLQTAGGELFTQDIAKEQSPLWRDLGYKITPYTRYILDNRPVSTGRCEW